MIVEDVSFGYAPESTLFRGASFRLVAGRTYALTGPSGSGKSTMLSLLNATARPSSGSITRRGIDSVNWVFQNPYGMARRTVMDHVLIPLLDMGQSTSDAYRAGHALLDRFHLGDLADQQFRTLSGGQAQRLMLARAVASEPDLLLVDEPTAQLDMRTAAHINTVMSELASDGRIVVIATHDDTTRAACSHTLSITDWLPPSNTETGTT